jgi:hypothetical protein
MKHRSVAGMLVLAGLLLAQAGAPDGSNLGSPRLYGTRTPEQNPATTVAPTPNYGTQAPAPSPAAGLSNPPATTNTGPGYSFGAAPPPIGAPGK